MDVQGFIEQAMVERLQFDQLQAFTHSRNAFGEDALAAVDRQVELRNEANTALLRAAEEEHRDLLRSEDDKFKKNGREIDQLMTFKKVVADRTRERNFVPATQGVASAGDSTDEIPLVLNAE